MKKFAYLVSAFIAVALFLYLFLMFLGAVGDTAVAYAATADTPPLNVSEAFKPPLQAPPLAADVPGTFQDFDLPNSGTPYFTATHKTDSPPPMLFAGGPTDVGQAMRLAFGQPPASDTSLAFPYTGLGSSDYVVADFDFRIKPDEGRADGLGFALLNVAHYGLTGTVSSPDGAEEPNFTDSLGIGIDIYQSGLTPTFELNYNHLSLHYDGVWQEFDVTPVVDFASNQWIHAQIVLQANTPNPNVTITLTPCGRPSVVVVDHYVIPGFMPYEGRVQFAARTGGEKSDFDIDNVLAQSLSDGQSHINFSTGCGSVVETEGEGTVTVVRSGDLSNPATVAYQTTPISASADTDFTAVSGVLTFASQQSEATITVPLIDDAADEGDERFLLTLSNASEGDIVSGPAVTRMIIIDDERARVVGHWSEVIPSGVIPIHAMLLPTGEVLYWDRDDALNTSFEPQPRIWNPETELIRAAATIDYELFCSGHTFLADGRLLVTGGHIDNGLGDDEASIYDPFTDTWERLPKINNGRWYPSQVTLPNGNVVVMGGTYDNHQAATLNDWPQVWDVATSQWLTPTNGQQTPNPDSALYYPYLFATSNGLVFNAGPQQMARYFDPVTGDWTDVAANSSLYRDYGTAVMYDIDKIMMTGGNPPPLVAPDTVPTSTTEIIDLTMENPTWKTVAPMHFGRRHANSTILPDGKILVTGGSNAPGADNRDGAVYAAEMWDPATETWTLLAEQVQYRGYHTTAVLLPDGRVLVGGGGHPDPYGTAQYNWEIYSPPYLFHESRPEIVAAPTTVQYGQTFFVETPDAAEIATINLIRLSGVTHAFAQDQRINRDLDFKIVPGGIEVTAPDNDHLAIPGYYQLFILDAEGIPSVGHFIQITHGKGFQLGQRLANFAWWQLLAMISVLVYGSGFILVVRKVWRG